MTASTVNSIMQHVAVRTTGKVQLSAGTLDKLIRRMLQQGLIQEAHREPDRRAPTSGAAITASRASDDGSLGLKSMLNRLVKQARATGLVPES